MTIVVKSLSSVHSLPVGKSVDFASCQLSKILGAFIFAATQAHGISILSTDSFGTTSESWAIGGAGAQPTWNSGVGQDGSSGFLSHFSDGGGPNGKWLMLSNQAEWVGNYTAAGITAVSLWADNAAGSPLGMRIAFDGPGGWFYSALQTVTNSTAGADWTQLSYNLVPANFTHATASGGDGNFASTMAGVTRFEIFGGASAVTYKSNGDLLEAGISTNTIRIDQISAIPEPSTVTTGLATLALAAMLRRRTTSPG